MASACAILVVALAGPAGGQAVDGRTVRDQVYSPAQAARGKVLFDAQCGGCHPGTGPALHGDEFLASWDHKAARALYSRILTTMPPDNPGSLSEGQVLDLVAYVLSANGFPPGSKPIASAGELNDLRIVREK